MRKRLAPPVAIPLMAVLMLPSSAAAACVIGFSNQTGLSLISKHQAYGILDLEDVPLGYYDKCPWGDWMYMDEDPTTSYQHFHIGPDNLAVFDCFTTTATYPDGVWGKMNGGTCVAINPLVVSRYVVHHKPAQWARFVDASSSTRNWRPSSIKVKVGSAPLQVQFRDQNGQNWWWGPLNASTSDVTYVLNQSGLSGKRAVKAWVTRFNTVGSANGAWDNFGVDLF